MSSSSSSCRSCGVEDILDDLTGLCIACHIAEAGPKRRAAGCDNCGATPAVADCPCGCGRAVCSRCVVTIKRNLERNWPPGAP